MAIDPTRMVLLKQIVAATDAKIVLSTSWREHWSKDWVNCNSTGVLINSIFSTYGLQIFDKTPELHERRETEIKSWLDMHPEVENFVVLDDRLLSADYLKGHFIKTSNYFDGLDEMDVQKAIETLNCQEGDSMVQTALFKEILKRANQVKEEFNAEHLTASHIAIAVADFCAIRYTGHTPLALQSSARFEEERLRYLFSKEVKVASYLRKKLSHNTKAGVQEKVFDIGCCDHIASMRKNDLLTADILFLSALKELDNAYRLTARNIVSEDSIFAALEDVDKNIYDYVIEKIEAICSELQEKADEAKAIRDWKPAEKFTEPEDLLKQFFDNVCVACENNVLHITMPGFLRETDLKLSIYKVKDHFIVHDNGCAVKSLSKRINSIHIQKVLNLLWDNSNLQDNKLVTQLTDVKFVLYFIQEVILTANADLYYEYFKEESFGHRRYIDPCKAFESEQQAESFDANAFLNTLKETVTAYYDENKGITLRFDAKYCHCSYGIRVLIETLDDGIVRFSDAYKNKQYETGEMLEAFYFSSTKECDDMYYEVMQELAKPFGMAIDMTSSIIFPEYNGRKHKHKNPYMLSTAPNWVRDFYKFMNSAVLISVVADRINYEKVREW